MFERQVYPQRRAADGAMERPYDVAGWTLPLQMGIEVTPVSEMNALAGDQSLTRISEASDVRRQLSLASEIRSLPRTAGRGGLYRGWTNSMDEGWTRWVFDHFKVAYKSLRDADLRDGGGAATAAALRAKYDVIILPSQSEEQIVAGRAAEKYPLEFTNGIGEAGVAALHAFVEQGGTLICFDAATQLAVKRFDLPVRNVLEESARKSFIALAPSCDWCWTHRTRSRRGLQNTVNGYFINSRAFEVLDPQRVRIVARYADRDLLQSGWLLGEQHIAGSPHFWR
ncbi:MAG: hypothetical protein WKF84_17050 [Pyrinomonadaceae bacterium]